MALPTGLARTVYARTLGSINFAGGIFSTDDLNQHARFLWNQMDPGRNYTYFDFLNVMRQVARDRTAALGLPPNAGPLWTLPTLPTDPTIAPGVTEFRARVLVTVTQPDGTSRTTLVVVDDSGAATPAELISRAIAQVQRDLGTNLVPPGFAPKTAGRPTWSGAINTIGRAPGT